MSSHSNSKRCFAIAGLFILALFAGGCATPSNPSAMLAKLDAPVTKHANSVAVTVTGGADTSSMGASNISSNDFAEAIKSSISESQLFREVAASGNPADYQIQVQIVRLDRPMFGLSFTVTLEATWRLIHSSDKQVVWEKAISSSFTATTGDAFSGVKRLRLANEGAARNNIKDAITQMGTLTLP
jgi:hypothetical protein